MLSISIKDYLILKVLEIILEFVSLLRYSDINQDAEKL